MTEIQKNDAANKRRRLVIRLLRKYDAACFYCSIPLNIDTCTVDHYIPRAAGGSNHIDNLRPACFPCNNDKADRVPLPDGTIPPKVLRIRIKKSDRPVTCNNCQNGRLLRADEWCPLCDTGPMPLKRPAYLKKRAWECNHIDYWCVACCIAGEDERSAMAMSRRNRELSEDNGLVGSVA